MLKYLLVIVVFLLMGQAGFMVSRRIHKARRLAGKVLDAYLPNEELLSHARQLAEGLSVSPSGDGLKNTLLVLDSDYDYITGVYRGLMERGSDEAHLPPAAEWILDNYYIVERHIKEIKMGMDKKSFAHLPVVEDGSFKGYPRVYAIAHELAAHRDARVEEETLTAFIESFQQVEVLTSAELWALPVMMKVVLIENIAYICRKIRLSVKEFDYADKYCGYIASRLDDEHWVTEKINRYFSHNSHINRTFVVSLIAGLKTHGARAIFALSLIDGQLERRGLSAGRLIDAEHSKQASRQVSMGNSIMGIVALSAMDWPAIFEECSETERLLRADPTGVYPAMDAASRDLYRSSIRRLAQEAAVEERVVVAKAFELAGAHKPEQRRGHIGYYLTGEGYCELVQRVYGRKVRCRGADEYAPQRYIALVCAVTLLIAGGVFLACLRLGWWAAAGIALAGAVPASQIAVSLINGFACKLKKVQLLPKLDLSDGIGQERASFVIVPTLLFDEKNVDELAANLESFYLANRDEHLYFGIVGDFKDGEAEENPGEAELAAYAAKQIRLLNERYPGETDRFFLFCRQRRFNESEGRWMGRERKRGAICDFVSFLKTGERGDFTTVTGDVSALPQIRYIITLDADTRLYQGTAGRLVGAMAHPLARPEIDRKRGVVTAGYGIMQPRVDVDIESANQTLFSKVFAGQGGLDQYSSAVSDVYQDLFGEGIFTGKGIFDVDAFEAVICGAFPDNTILSHDLLEGSYLRCGLLSDVEVSDGYPAKYLSHMSRLHRWVRGDWQLITRLGRRVKNARGERVESPLSVLSKWKIIDNLRRSLFAPMSLLTLAAGVLLPSPQRWWAAGLAVLAVGFPLLRSIAGAVSSGYLNLARQKSNATIIYGVKGALLEFAVDLVTLPYQAYLMADAIVRTVWRLYVSHKNMLEWVTAADAEKRSKGGLWHHYGKMWFAPAAGAAVMLGGAVSGGAGMILGILFGVLWLLAPYTAWLISRPEREQNYEFGEDERKELRLLARRTWRYFEEFAGAADNYLPPDNYQSDPPNGVAHRTSPTNIGLLLVSCLAARDFGYLTTGAMLERITRTLDTIDKLVKWRGHLLNWYDTKTLEAMPPRYVSTVDSGNYLAYVITLREGLKNLAGGPDWDISNLRGLCDTVRAAKEERADLSLSDELLFSLEQRESVSSQEAGAAVRALLDCDLSAAGDWGEAIGRMAQQLLRAIDQPEDANLDASLGLVIDRLTKIAGETSFLPLFDQKRQLFSIGYNVEEEKLTDSYYDLLASEARQTSFLAIAKGEVSYKHWFKLGRSLAGDDGYRGLVSWTGTMFEYLMPLLIMKSYKNTLLDESYWFAVREQIKYARKRSSVWGTSESGFFAFDQNLNYQYKAFGVPLLGLRRGLSSEAVVAPYASVMALMVNPAEAYENIKRLRDMGMQGDYGMYEAADFTARRLAAGERYALVKSYMVHHQGMSFLALDNVLFGNVMQQRFGQAPAVRAVDYLLCERIPTHVIFTNATKYESQLPHDTKNNVFYCVRSFQNPKGYLPEAHVLSNRKYSVVLTDRGGGYSQWEGVNITRWRSDLLNPYYGSFVYVAQEGTNSWWSATPGPTARENESASVVFSCGQAEYFRSDGPVDTHTQVFVAAQDNVEVRRVTLTNHSKHEKNIALTSYQEVVLAPQSADEAHPAFSNLFVRTEFDEKYGALLAGRRRRSESDDPVWAFHCALAEDESVLGPISYETDRAKFIGRGKTAAGPAAMTDGQPLTNTTGAVLDPIFSIRCRVRLAPGATVSVSFVTGAGRSREELSALCAKYTSPGAVQTAFELAQTRMQLENKYLALKEGEEEEILRLLPHLLFSSPLKEKYADVIRANTLPQSALWAYGISGDLPVLLFTISDTNGLPMADRLLKAHEYFTIKGIACDLVILCRQEAGYAAQLSDAVAERVSLSHARDKLNQNGGVFVLSSSAMTREEAELLVKAARVAVDGADIRLVSYTPPALRQCSRTEGARTFYETPQLKAPELEYFNGYGGFDAQTGDYVIVLRDGENTPLPWCNVLANREFGCVVSESGGGYSYAGNSRENKLTPWSNDPVGDTVGEVCYLRDTDTGETFTITPRPLRDSKTYLIRHGAGATVYSHNAAGIEATQTVFVPPDEPVKLIMLHLKNPTEKRRSFTATYVLRPVLGVDLSWNRYVASEYDGEVLYLTSQYNADFAQTAFLTCSGETNTVTTDASAFVSGADGIPGAVCTQGLDGKTGAGYDSVAAMQTVMSVEAGSEKTLVFVFGQCADRERIAKLAQKYKGSVAAEYALTRTRSFWEEFTGGVRVSTPQPSFDLMVNSWLLYQAAACRLFARSAFYQAGGAFGFRDQLQDSLALLHTAPQLARSQILLHAAHQFVEGDVQHWWHPVSRAGADADKGIRTRFSDDLFWLVYVTCEYIRITGDWSILEEEAGYLESEPLGEETDERYETPRVSAENGTLYSHCLRVLTHGLKTGPHGLLLMGSGDWNDGMNTVGNKGKGESVWLSWFVYDLLGKFIPVCERQGDHDLAQRYGAFCDELKRNLEANAWDGNWYRRAYFDDGTPLGSSQNPECRIDAIAQAWAAISGAGDSARVKTAMESLQRYLVKRENGLIMLLTPAFDDGELEPGYIKSYVPGVRENGGQYTHGAVWTVMALARMGEGDRAWEYFNMLNPINHGRTPIEIMQYKAEPYVVAADVYTNPQHMGRGGWTWYTGSAAWFYKIALEELLGLKREGDILKIEPCIPSGWDGFSVNYRYGGTWYEIRVTNPDGVCRGRAQYESKDTECSEGAIRLADDGKAHSIRVKICPDTEEL